MKNAIRKIFKKKPSVPTIFKKVEEVARKQGDVNKNVAISKVTLDFTDNKASLIVFFQDNRSVNLAISENKLDDAVGELSKRNNEYTYPQPKKRSIQKNNKKNNALQPRAKVNNNIPNRNNVIEPNNIIKNTNNEAPRIFQEVERVARKRGDVNKNVAISKVILDFTDNKASLIVFFQDNQRVNLAISENNLDDAVGELLERNNEFAYPKVKQRVVQNNNNNIIHPNRSNNENNENIPSKRSGDDVKKKRDIKKKYSSSESSSWDYEEEKYYRRNISEYTRHSSEEEQSSQSSKKVNIINRINKLEEQKQWLRKREEELIRERKEEKIQKYKKSSKVSKDISSEEEQSSSYEIVDSSSEDSDNKKKNWSNNPKHKKVTHKKLSSEEESSELAPPSIELEQEQGKNLQNRKYSSKEEKKPSSFVEKTGEVPNILKRFKKFAEEKFIDENSQDRLLSVKYLEENKKYKHSKKEGTYIRKILFLEFESGMQAKITKGNSFCEVRKSEDKDFTLKCRNLKDSFIEDYNFSWIKRELGEIPNNKFTYLEQNQDKNHGYSKN